MNDTKSDKINLNLLLERDPNQILKLYQKLYPMLDNFFRRYNLPEADITDTIQEVMISLFTKTEKIDSNFRELADENSEIPVRKLIPYALVIARNALYSKLRSTSTKDHLIAVFSDGNESKTEDFTLSSETLNIFEALSKLDEKSKKIIILRYLENRSAAEIADLLNINRRTVANITYRAITRLKSFLKRNLNQQ